MYIESECGVSMAKQCKKAETMIMVKRDELLCVYTNAGSVYIQIPSVVGLCSVVWTAVMRMVVSH